MAEQISLFGGNLSHFSPPPAKPARRGANPLLDFAALPVPPKLGPPAVRFGTSSWTYPGWQGKVYRDVAAYGSAQRFTELCLAEYARDPRFRCAGADNMYYMPPSSRLALLKRYRSQLEPLPEPVELLPKVWHGVSVNRYSPLQREQWRLRSEINANFLDPQTFLDAVARPLREGLGPFLGPILLELQENDIHSTEFTRHLDGFLGAVMPELASGEHPARLAVELRTQAHLTPRYFEVLRSHGATHVLNAWTRMPPIGLQYQKMRAAAAEWPFWVLRALLNPGMRYEDASIYDPYDRIVTRHPEVREDMLRVLRDAGEASTSYVLVNNHLEGHSPGTIAELQESLWDHKVAKSL